MVNLGLLNDTLSHTAYLKGFHPSAEDAETWTLITAAPKCGEYPHLARWWMHMQSYEAKERKGWGGASCSGSKKEEKEEEIDLFGSDDEEESEEKKKLTEQRLKAYAEKKSKKPGPIAKSSVILDVKPWDDETNMEEMEQKVRAIQRDGLVWGGAKFIPLAYGIRKLQIICVIEDDKVSVDDLIESITEDIADHVQSVDISAFNKI